jgi:hypothetical protein
MSDGMPTIRIRLPDNNLSDLFVVELDNLDFDPFAGRSQPRDAPALADLIARILDEFQPVDRAAVAVHKLRLAVEEFVLLWNQASADIGLSPDDRRTGDALAEMASEVVKAEPPFVPVLRAAFSWFTGKLDQFSEEAARAAGKAFGTSAGVGAGLAVTGHLPRLIEAATKAAQVLHQM